MFFEVVTTVAMTMAMTMVVLWLRLTLKPRTRCHHKGTSKPTKPCNNFFRRLACGYRAVAAFQILQHG